MLTCPLKKIALSPLFILSSEGQMASNVLNIVAQPEIPVKGRLRFRAALIPGETPVELYHSSHSPPSPFCFPYSLTDADLKSTHQTPCLRISLLTSTSWETQMMTATTDLNFLFRNISQIHYPVFLRPLHSKALRFQFFYSCLL